MARDAGYISYEGLPGSIRTGCINSPAYNSRFCEDHAEFVCNLETASDEEKLLVLPLNVRSSLTDRSPVQEPRQMEKSQIKSL